MAGFKNKQHLANKLPKRGFGGGHFGRFEAPAKAYTKEEHERQREVISDVNARRLALAADEKISVTVISANPLVVGSTMYRTGDHPLVRRDEATALAARGMVTIP